jgi:hypothetical protein
MNLVEAQNAVSLFQSLRETAKALNYYISRTSYFFSEDTRMNSSKFIIVSDKNKDKVFIDGDEDKGNYLDDIEVSLYYRAFSTEEELERIINIIQFTRK